MIVHLEICNMMTPEEYKTKNIVLKQEYEKKRRDIDISFAVSNNIIQKDDIIKSDTRIGKVIKYEFYRSPLNLPQLVYVCEQLKSNGKPRIDKKIIKIYQCNVIEINGKEYKYPFK